MFSHIFKVLSSVIISLFSFKTEVNSFSGIFVPTKNKCKFYFGKFREFLNKFKPLKVHIFLNILFKTKFSGFKTYKIYFFMLINCF